MSFLAIIADSSAESDRSMDILGVSAFYHDSAACLVRDGKILCAAQEERFTRKKHDFSFPRYAIEFCLKEAGIDAERLDLVAFYDKPFLKFERILQTYLAYAPGHRVVHPGHAFVDQTENLDEGNDRAGPGLPGKDPVPRTP
jgi:carbamoyltransferase